MKRFYLEVTFLVLAIGLISFSLSGCQPTQATPALLRVSITADGKVQQLSITPGSTVQDALSKTSISLGKLDRTEPIANSIITSTETSIKVIRVRETFEVKEITNPFERQIVRNESLPVSQTILVQPGVNGIQEITYRYLYEDGIETSKTIVKSVIVKEAVPEITMVGVQTPFAALPIQGRLAYLYSGSVWIMEKSTGNRRPLVSSGDLDGQVFAISPDGIWLLFTRKPQNPSTDIINTLWVVKTSGETPQILDLKVENIKNYAGWIPNETRTIAYTTVEPRSTAPGYQANNDLQTLTFTESGQVKPGPEIIGPNSGGIYGWWGTTFAWSPDGKQLAYARPDSVGLVDLKEGQFIPNLNLTPLQTHSDWAWMPTVNWAPDGKILLTVTHAPGTGQVAAEESPFFDLSAILLYGGPTVNLIPQSGMFAYPVASPVMTKTGYQVAYLQAIFPDQSNTSRYKLMVIDRDGSNHRVIFPPEGSPGVEPQQVVWAPQSSADSEVIIAITYQKNLWLINLNSGETYQMTGDSLITNIDWK